MATTVLVGTNRNYLDTDTDTKRQVAAASIATRFAEKIPHIEVPCECQFYRWLAIAGGDYFIVRHAIDRAGGKARATERAGGVMDEMAVASFVMRIIRIELKHRNKTGWKGRNDG